MSAAVCLTTYNGARWLPEQLDSLIAQTDTNWRLYVSDDGSSDATRDLLQDYRRRESRITLLADRQGPRGAVANFEYVLAAAAGENGQSPDFLALCDQDDIWEPDKLARQRQQLVTTAGCCSDLLLVDADGRSRGKSLLRQLAAPAHPGTATLLAQNSVVGCTLALRPEVLELALPFPPGLCNHDWWLGLCVLAIGELHYDQTMLVRYRQHDGNEVGAFRPMRQLLRASSILDRQRRVIEGQLCAVRSLLERLRERRVIPDASLKEYLRRVGAESALGRMSAQLRGPFAASGLPLRLLKSLAAPLVAPNPR